MVLKMTYYFHKDLSCAERYLIQDIMGMTVDQRCQPRPVYLFDKEGLYGLHKQIESTDITVLYDCHELYCIATASSISYMLLKTILESKVTLNSCFRLDTIDSRSVEEA